MGMPSDCADYAIGPSTLASDWSDAHNVARSSTVSNPTSHSKASNNASSPSVCFADCGASELVSAASLSAGALLQLLSLLSPKIRSALLRAVAVDRAHSVAASDSLSGGCGCCCDGCWHCRHRTVCCRCSKCGSGDCCNSLSPPISQRLPLP
ncbi:hypothetical protein JKP88DRAFT_238566 [Tribonema minus]|uniref:Uncharacterized protein n=1 Tax=Tribonema minus TaxID=303371 RepID=A0A835YXP3_9STRA|nr:hypothetical protein JKP88DRAFT_238566 [Tribonema minus]